MYGVSIVFVILIIYVYNIQYNKGEYEKIFLTELINNEYLKTGDIIIFKSYNNFNSVLMGNYYSHIGVVYIDPDDEKKIPLLFEANGVENMNLLNHHNKNGIFLSPVEERIQKYKGRAFVKRLNKKVDEQKIKEFKYFIDFCLKNMSYEYNIIKSAVYKYLSLERCGKKTNCGELVFLSILKLGLISIEEYDKSCLHYLKWMSYVKELNYGYSYMDILEIIDYPFNI